METGGVMCEECETAFREEIIVTEDEDTEDTSLPKDILEILKYKEKYTYEKLKSTVLWLNENQYFDEARDLELFIKKQHKQAYHSDKIADDKKKHTDVFEEDKMDGHWFVVEDEEHLKAENESETIFDENNTSEITQRKFGALNPDDLKEYLKIVVNMEQNIYLQNNMLSQMKMRYSQLGRPRIYDELDEPEDSSKDSFITGILYAVLALVGFILLRLGIKLCTGSGSNSFIFGLIALIIGGIMLIYGLFVAIGTFGQSFSDKRKYADDKREFEASYEKYENNIQSDKKRVSQEELEKKVLSSEIASLQKQNSESKQNLNQIYSLNIIFPKYRNLVMLCSIYEYICAGRCSTLEGHEGAYNILEMEIRLDRIITQLDMIVNRLDDIRNNQYVLYSAIQETNQQIAQISKSTDYVLDSLKDFHGQATELADKISSIEKNSMLGAYQAERVQKELQYLNRMDYLSGKYDNVFYNAPPS
ncbi:MAG: DUF308 domain-containing protein [Lachnospiraceae bacterium]|nr:DUF308 domain-containing protein [Lachnospiraceae bacterium]